MKALGYEPSLAGMDDDDIEWELSKMEEAERRREAPPQPQRTVYRPVDPGLAARIFRQMGQPYDPNAISPQESFYLNGWDNGDDEEVKPLVPQNRDRQSVKPFNPWKNIWKLDWGEEGNVSEKPRTMEYRPEQDESIKPVLYSSEGADLRGVKEVPARAVGTGSDAKSTRNADIFEPVKNAINVKKFWDEVYQEARETQKMEHEEAVRKANEAAILYTGYLGGTAVAMRGVTSITKNTHTGAATGFLGWANADNAKSWIKNKVFEPYNPVWDGTTSD